MSLRENPPSNPERQIERNPSLRILSGGAGKGILFYEWKNDCECENGVKEDE